MPSRPEITGMDGGIEPERVVDVRCEIGENPLWHPSDERLYWCDIPQGRIHWYEPGSGDDGIAHESTDRIGGFTRQADGTLLLFQGTGIVRRLDPATDSVETVVGPDPERFETRFNDVIADPDGRVYAGTMPDRSAGVPGRLYRLDRDGTFEVVDECYLPNGMGFDGDLSAFYFTDSAEDEHGEPGRIYRYDYDKTTGELTDPAVFADSADEDGFHDGMTVDQSDHVWSAFWEGAHVTRYRPDGSRVASISFPARKVSSLTFGGPDHEQAYVTTACEETRETEGDGAGALFRFEPDVNGRAEYESRIDL